MDGSLPLSHKNMFLPENDGVDHINVYSKGRTALGRWLSNFADCNITIGEDGFFRTLEGYWYWLTCHNDKLRILDGFNAKKYGRRVGGSDWSESPIFIERFKQAVDLKLRSNRAMFEALTKNDLPLDHYYVYNGSVTRPSRGLWLLDHITTAPQRLS